jgi:hypothetical protein
MMGGIASAVEGALSGNANSVQTLRDLYGRQYDEGTSGFLGPLNRLVWGSREEFLQNAGRTAIDDYFEANDIPFNQRGEMRNRWNQLVENQFMRGTGGFRDFGAGQPAILHGKEAVIPFDSPEGRILQSIYNSPADRVAGAGTGSTVIVNQPVNNVTAPVNVVDGGTQTSIQSYGFGGGGGSSNNPMGIPGVTSGLAH